MQNRSAARGNNVSGGTGLHHKFAWPQGKEVLLEALSRLQPERRPLQRLLVTSEWSGRTGNLLFEWAALVGMAARLRTSVPATEAVYLRTPSSSDVPVRAFFEQFALGSTTRTLPNANASFASVFAGELESGVACRVNAPESRPHVHDDALVRGLEAWAQSPPKGKPNPNPSPNPSPSPSSSPNPNTNPNPNPNPNQAAGLASSSSVVTSNPSATLAARQLS